MQIQLLGNVELHRTECEQGVVRPARAAERCVLATLAFTPGHLVSAAALIDNIGLTRTGSEPTPQTLNGYVRTLRGAITRAGGISTSLRTVSRSRSYVLDVDPDTIDYHRIRAQANASQAGDTDLLDHLLSEWSPEALADLNCVWAQRRRRALDIERRHLYEQLIGRRLAARQYREVFQTVTTLLEQAPPTDNLLLAGARALAGSGQHAAIPDWVAHTTQHMRETVDIEPSSAVLATIAEFMSGHAPTSPIGSGPEPVPTAEPDQIPTVQVSTATSSTGYGDEGSAAMFTLPADLPEFTGRDQELRSLFDTVLATGNGQPQTIAIHAIDGMAGIGKTTFSVHAAYRLADRFPHGLMFHHLRGCSPGHSPIPPGEALFSLLVATGIAPQAIPRDLDDRARLWRNRMAGKKFILILDDAADHDQVRPLLPATAGSLVLITSRQRLSALDGVQPLTLDLMSTDEATTMLLRLAHLDPTSHDIEAVAEIVQQCGHLPLAIALVAGRLRSHPAWTPRHLAALLSGTHELLDHLAVGDRSVRAAFDVSFENLPAGSRHAYTLLGGVHPGPEIDAYALAALTQTSLRQAEDELEFLHADHLVQEISPGRYRLHDLLRAYTATRADTLDVTYRHQALHRVLDHYLHTAHTAHTYLPRHHTPTTTTPLPSPPRDRPHLTDQQQARRWLDTELATLRACIQHTHTTHPDHTLALSATLHPYLRLSFALDHAHSIHHTALVTSRDTNNRHAQATSLHDLSIVCWVGDDYAETEQCLLQAQHIYVEIGDQLGHANTLHGLGLVHRLRGHYDRAEHTLTQAQHIYTEIDDPRGRAVTLNDLGCVHERQGQYDRAEQTLDRARQIFIGIGHPLGHANTLKNLGVVHRLRGQYQKAEQLLTQARECYSEMNHQMGYANTLKELGTVHRMEGRYEQAEHDLTYAQQLHTDLGHTLGQANNLRELGDVHHQQRRYQTALDHLTQALTLFRDIGSRDGEAETLNSLGYLAFDHPQAGDPHGLFTRAHSLAGAIDAPTQQAQALRGLGRCAERAGQVRGATTAYRDALAIYRRLRHPEADTITNLLATLETNDPKQI